MAIACVLHVFWQIHKIILQSLSVCPSVCLSIQGLSLVHPIFFKPYPAQCSCALWSNEASKGTHEFDETYLGDILEIFGSEDLQKEMSFRTHLDMTY